MIRRLKNFEELLLSFKKKLSRNERNKELFDRYDQTKAIDRVILVGGSSKIPKIRSLLREFFSEEKLTSTVDPEKAVTGKVITP